jgi:hypothetical protein
MQVSTQLPSMHFLPGSQSIPAQDGTHAYVVKSLLGLHTSPGKQDSGWQGLSTQAPR